MIFKHLLTAWFLAFTLLSSVSWAHGGHGDETHAGSGNLSVAEHEELQPWQNDNCSDHCCHASSHVIALTASVCVFGAGPFLSSPRILSDIYPDSLPDSPPFHPPIA